VVFFGGKLLYENLRRISSSIWRSKRLVSVVLSSTATGQCRLHRSTNSRNGR
jgi:hypothetical protein